MNINDYFAVFDYKIISVPSLFVPSFYLFSVLVAVYFELNKYLLMK